MPLGSGVVFGYRWRSVENPGSQIGSECSTLVSRRVFRGTQRSSEGNTFVFGSGGRGVLLFSFEGLRGPLV